jgi:membrane protein
MLETIKAILRLFAKAYEAWIRDAAIQLGAAIAFYTALSLAPLLIFAITLASTIPGVESVEGRLVTQTEEIAGHDAAGTIGAIINQEYTIPAGTGILGSLAGLASLILGASVLFWQIKRALNIVWGIQRQPRSRVRGVLKFIQGRLLASAMVIGTGTLLLLSVTLDTSLTALRQWLTATMPELVHGERVLSILQALKFVMSFSLITFAIIIVYKILPDADLAWKDAWIGASVTSLMLSIGNLGIGWYLATWSFRSAYGAAGSLLAFLMWVYFSAQVFFFGAEFTRAYADSYGSGIVPHKDTFLITRRYRTQYDLTQPEGVQMALDDALAADAIGPLPGSLEDAAAQETAIHPASEREANALGQRARRTLRYGGALAAGTALIIGVYYAVRRATSRSKKGSGIER